MAKITKDTSLRKAILLSAITGQLINDIEGATETGKQLLDRIIEERNAKLITDWKEAKKKNPKTQKPALIVASEIAEDKIPFEIPKSWYWCRLGEICNLYNKNSINKTEKKMKYTNAKDVGFYQIINYENGIKILFFRIAPKNTVLMYI